jgi:hypothetical protein
MMASTLMIVLTFGLSQPILRVCRLVPMTSPWATSPLEAVHGADRSHAPPAGPVALIVPVPIRRADIWDSVPWAVENTTGRRNGLRVGQVADHPFHLLPGLHPNGDPLATGHARLETRRPGPTDS